MMQKPNLLDDGIERYLGIREWGIDRYQGIADTIVQLRAAHPSGFMAALTDSIAFHTETIEENEHEDPDGTDLT